MIQAGVYLFSSFLKMAEGDSLETTGRRLANIRLAPNNAATIPCNKCDETFASKCQVKKHVREVHQEKVQAAGFDDQGKPSTYLTYLFMFSKSIHLIGSLRDCLNAFVLRTLIAILRTFVSTLKLAEVVRFIPFIINFLLIYGFNRSWR